MCTSVPSGPYTDAFSSSSELISSAFAFASSISQQHSSPWRGLGCIGKGRYGESSTGVRQSGRFMTKAEIIAKTLGSMKLNDEPDYQTIVIAELQRKLPAGVEIKTCEDFRHLGVECCDTCHNFYPHYEMQVIQLPDGSPAWVCDTGEVGDLSRTMSRTTRVEPELPRGQAAQKNLRGGRGRIGHKEIATICARNWSKNSSNVGPSGSTIGATFATQRCLGASRMTTAGLTSCGGYAETWNRWSLNSSRRLDASLKSCK